MNAKEKAEIIKAYQTSKNSIQDIARIYRVDVKEVLELIGESNLSTVTLPGDMIDATEIGPGASVYRGKDIDVNISVH